MSLMKTLAKVAVGVAVAKGASAMMNRGKQGNDGKLQQTGGLGGLLGGLTGGTTASGQGGLSDMLGGLLGGGNTTGGTRRGGLGGLLENLGGQRQGGDASTQGGLGDMLGGLAGGAAAGGLLGGLGKTVNKAPPKNSESFGAVLNSQFDQSPEQPIEPSQDQEAVAALMLAAMIQAAKSDGTFDESEQRKLLGHLGEVDEDEAAFIQRRMQAPVDVDALVADTPDGMGPQVYTMSVLAIDLDTQEEAQYLHKLASGYGMTPAQVNEIHAELGVASLYA